jgi:hypothetical protein
MVLAVLSATHKYCMYVQIESVLALFWMHFRRQQTQAEYTWGLSPIIGQITTQMLSSVNAQSWLLMRPESSVKSYIT